MGGCIWVCCGVARVKGREEAESGEQDGDGVQHQQWRSEMDG